MRAFGKFLGRLLLGLVVIAGGLWVLGPYEAVDLEPSIDTSAVSGDLDAYFSGVEAAWEDITPGVEKRVVWAGDAGAKTDWAVIYIHGFSATSEEIRPVPDNVAADLGANLIYTRLRGHGRPGPAMGEATAHDWMNDVAEALAAGRQVGDRLLLISTSTGGTLVAAAAQDQSMMEQVAGSVFVSPNFGVNNPAAGLLTWPAVRYWLPALVGSERGFEPLSEEQGTYWTTSYPSVAALPMAALVKEVVALDHSQARIPAMFRFTEADQVVVAGETRKVAAAWGGPVSIENPVMADGDDPSSHVIAGDIVSPGQTDATVSAILDWVKGL